MLTRMCEQRNAIINYHYYDIISIVSFYGIYGKVTSSTPLYGSQPIFSISNNRLLWLWARQCSLDHNNCCLLVHGLSVRRFSLESW